MSQGDWQAYQGAWMGQMDTWRTRTDERFDWMYDHTVCQMQYLSTRDHLDPFFRSTHSVAVSRTTHPMDTMGTSPGYDYRYGPPSQCSFYVMLCSLNNLFVFVLVKTIWFVIV